MSKISLYLTSLFFLIVTFICIFAVGVTLMAWNDYPPYSHDYEVIPLIISTAFFMATSIGLFIRKKSSIVLLWLAIISFALFAFIPERDMDIIVYEAILFILIIFAITLTIKREKISGTSIY